MCVVDDLTLSVCVCFGVRVYGEEDDVKLGMVIWETVSCFEKGVRRWVGVVLWWYYLGFKVISSQLKPSGRK